MTTAPEADPDVWRDELARVLDEAVRLTPWDTLLAAARRYPERPAVAGPEGELTYEELVDRALVCASRLAALGVGKGTVVGTMFESSADWLVIHYALGRLGALAMPMNYTYAARELQAVLTESRPELIITGGEVAGIDCAALLVAALPAEDTRVIHVVDDAATALVFGTRDDVGLDPVGAAAPGDPSLILFTSGSTARPKGAVIAGRGFAGNGAALAAALRMTPEDRFILLFPNFHAMGAVLATTVASAGAAIHLTNVFTPVGALDLIESARCTTTFGLDTHWIKLLADPTFEGRDLSSLVRVGSGGSRGLWEQLQAKLGPDVIATAYGSTELSSWGTLSAPARLPDSQGVVLPGLDFRIVDPDSGRACGPGEPGEICYRGWARFLGYLLPEGGFAEVLDEDGYFHSGDYGQFDEQGRLHYLGRYKMMVKTGGENVSEIEVETFLKDSMDDIDVAQVVGAPDPVWGEAIVAFVQYRPGCAPVDSEAMRERCRGGIARFKIPKLFVTVDAADWPLLANNKIDKKVLRVTAADAYAAHLEAGDSATPA